MPRFVGVAGACRLNWHGHRGADIPNLDSLQADATPQIYLSCQQRPILSISPFHTTIVEERQLAQSIFKHLAAELSRLRVAKVRLVSPANGHRPVTHRRYSLVGRLMLASGKVRLAIRLVNDVTGYHVWAESFDGVADEPFALQHRVSHGVIAGVCPALISAEIDRLRECPAGTLGAREMALRAFPLALAADVDSARQLLQSVRLRALGFLGSVAISH